MPHLLRRLGNFLELGVYLEPQDPIRRKRSELVRPGVLERDIESAARRLQRCGCILVLVDGDDDCPKTRGPELLARARAARSDMPIGLVLAHREYEAWFLAAAESLRGTAGLAPDLSPPDHPEAIRGAKEWLRKHMPRGRTYREAGKNSDQAQLTQCFDMALARERSRSFKKLCKDIKDLVSQARCPTACPPSGVPCRDAIAGRTKL